MNNTLKTLAASTLILASERVEAQIPPSAPDDVVLFYCPLGDLTNCAELRGITRDEIGKILELSKSLDAGPGKPNSKKRKQSSQYYMVEERIVDERDVLAKLAVTLYTLPETLYLYVPEDMKISSFELAKSDHSSSVKWALDDDEEIIKPYEVNISGDFELPLGLLSGDGHFELTGDCMVYDLDQSRPCSPTETLQLKTTPLKIKKAEYVSNFTFRVEEGGRELFFPFVYNPVFVSPQ